MRIVLATKNAGKVREISEIMSKYNIEVVSQKDIGIDVDVEETGTTFEENAEIKARAVSMLCDDAVLADDSGLCIDALGGRPGIYSARYGGENSTFPEKINGILSELNGIATREAHFECSMVLVLPNGKKLVGNGRVEGTILYEPKGTGGFGYDSIFYSSELGKSFGEASEEEKNKISHRSRAISALCEEIEKLEEID